MSNHDGSYMLNEVLCLLENHDFFDELSEDSRAEFIQELVDIGKKHDCNSGEILEGVGERLSICYRCLKYSAELEDGHCLEACR